MNKHFFSDIIYKKLVILKLVKVGGYMNELVGWYRRIGKKILVVILSIIGAYLFFKYLIPYTAPFIIAWAIASLLQVIVKWLNERLQMQRGIGTMLSMVIVLSAISWGVTTIVRKMFIQANNLYQKIPLFREDILEVFENITDKTKYLFSALPFNSTISLEKVVDQLLQSLAGFLGSFVSKGSINVVSKLPNILFFTIITLLSIFFMTRDYQQIERFIIAQVPSDMVKKVRVLKEDLIKALGGYIKTQLILMCITTTICIIGFLLLGVKNAIGIAFVIGVFDALPMFGSGAFLIPWALYNLIIGKYSAALGLGAIYALIVVVRQTVEPRILSNQIGVYTLITLIAMYMGFKLMGVIGLIIGPILVIVLQTLQKVGLVPEFKKMEEK